MRPPATGFSTVSSMTSPGSIRAGSAGLRPALLVPQRRQPQRFADETLVGRRKDLGVDLRRHARREWCELRLRLAPQALGCFRTHRSKRGVSQLVVEDVQPLDDLSPARAARGARRARELLKLSEYRVRNILTGAWRPLLRPPGEQTGRRALDVGVQRPASVGILQIIADRRR